MSDFFRDSDKDLTLALCCSITKTCKTLTDPVILLVTSWLAFFLLVLYLLNSSLSCL